MKGSTHLASGVCAAAICTTLNIHPGSELAVAAGIIIGSVLPDIDKSSSHIGRHVPIIPRLLKHRGVSHSLLLAALFLPFAPSITAGCIIHLLLDMMNPAGVNLLWPWDKKFRLPIRGKSGGWLDKLIGSLLWTLALLLFLCIVLGVDIPGLPKSSVLM